MTGYAIYGEEWIPRAKDTLHLLEHLYSEHPGLDALWFAEAQGTKEGLYAKIYHARDRLGMKWVKRTEKWSIRLSLDAPAAAIVHEVVSLLDTTVTEATTKQQADAKKAILVLLTGLLSQYADLAQEVRNLAAQARAEGTALGTAAAAALLALQNKVTPPDIDQLAKETVVQLQQSEDYWKNVNEIVDDMMAGLAGDLSRSLPAQVQAGSSNDSLQDFVHKTLAAGIGAGFYLDEHVHAAFALAMLIAYRRANPTGMLNFVTVGDERVCSSCDANEAGNPYTYSDVPPIPYHGSCRCWYEQAN